MSTLRRELQQTRDFDSLEQETFLNLQRTAGLLAGPLDQMLKEHGLSPSQYNVLRILRGQAGEGLACTPIGERMVSRVPDVTRLVDKLIRLGLAVRQRSTDDRRVVLISITSAGLKVLKQLDKPLAAVHRQSLAHMSAAELRKLNKLLVKARTTNTGD